MNIMSNNHNDPKFQQFLKENFSCSPLTEDNKRRLEKSSMYKIWLLGRYMDQLEGWLMDGVEKIMRRLGK
jgi:hypothetical protein